MYARARNILIELHLTIGREKKKTKNHTPRKSTNIFITHVITLYTVCNNIIVDDDDNDDTATYNVQPLLLFYLPVNAAYCSVSVLSESCERRVKRNIGQSWREGDVQPIKTHEHTKRETERLKSGSSSSEMKGKKGYKFNQYVIQLIVPQSIQ